MPFATDLPGQVQQFSGLAPPAGAALPAPQPLADDTLSRNVCPQERQGCRAIVAAEVA